MKLTVVKNKLTALGLVAAALLLARPAFAAIGTPVVIGRNSSTNASTTLAVTVPAGGVAVGNTILVTFAMDPTAGNATVADTGGNTYTLDRAITNGSVTTGVKTYVFSAPVTTALTAGNTITVTFPSTASKAVNAFSVSGLVISSAADKSAANSGNSTTPSSGATATTAQADELLLGAIGAEARISLDTLTPGNAFTTLTNASADVGNSGNSITIYSTYRLVSTNGAFTASGTLSGGTARNWAAAIVTYKAINLTAQTITFTSPGNQTYGVAPLILGATASSGLAVNYTVSGGATISGSTLTITNAGSVTIVATQPGDSTYAAATPVTNTFTVAPVALTVSGVTANNKNYNGNPTATINTNTATLNGVLGGETVALGGNPTGTFADKNTGTNKTVTITGLTLTGAQASHYSLTQPTAVADILAATLTVTATGTNRAYDGTTAATVTFADNRAPGDVLTVSGSAEFDTAVVGNGKTVTVTNLALAGAGAGNYALTNTTITTTANITAKSLTVTGITASNKIYDRTNTATLDTSAAVLGAGVIGSEVVVLDASAAVGTFTSSNVANGITVTVNGLLLTGADAGNYSATATTTANITKLPLTIVSGLTANNKNYNGNPNATVATNGVTFDAVIAPDAVTLRTNGYTAAFANKHTGAAKPVTMAGLTLSGVSSNNYSLLMPTNLVADILATNVTVTARGNTKFYDATVTATNTPNLTAGSLQTGDTNAFTETYATAAAGLTNKVLIPAGVVNDGNGGSNYNVTFANFNTGTITPKVLFATGITATNKVYDRTTAAVIDTTAAALTGILPPDDVLLNTNSGVGAFTNSNAANNISVIISGLTLGGVDAANYSVTASNATANITKLALSIASGFTANNKIYNGTLAATIASNTVTLTGVIAGDTITARTNGYTAAFADKLVGTNKPVTVTGIQLGGSTATNNYTLLAPTNFSANITAATLTITASAANKIYDGTTTAAVTLTNNKVASDTITQTFSTAAFADKNTGTNKTITVADLTVSGADLDNYVLASTNITATANITRRPVALAGTKIYDATTLADSSELTITNNVDGVDLALTGSGALAAKNVGAQTIAAASSPARIQTRTGTGNNAANFAVTLGSAPVNGHTLVAFVSVNTNTTTRGLASIAQTGASWTRAAQSTTTGALAEIWFTTNLANASTNLTFNYVATSRGQAVVVEYSGLLTVNAVDQIVSASGTGTAVAAGPATPTTQANELWLAAITYTNSGYNLGGVTGGFTVVTNVAGGSGTAANNTDLYALEQSVSATNPASIGGTITTNSHWAALIVTFKAAQLGAPLALTGAEATNYTLTGATGSLLVTAKNLALTGLAATAKIYDGSSVAPLTGTAALLAAEIPGSGSDVDGAPFSGDALALTGTPAGQFADANAALAKPVTVTGSTLTGAQAGNYVLTAPTNLVADLTPQTPVVAVAPVATDLAPGQALSASTLSGGSVTNAAGSNVPGSFTFTAPTNTPPLGTNQQAVTFTPADSTNYAAAATTASVAVVNNVSSQTITFAALTGKTYGDATFGLSATASSSLPVTFTVQSGPATLTGGTNVTVTGAGSVTLRASQAGNISYTAAPDVDRSFIVAVKSLAPSVAVDNKIYDGLTAASITNRALTGVINGDNVALTNGTANFADKNVGTNKTVVTTNLVLTGTAAANYVLAASSVTNVAAITVRSLTATVTGVNKIYDGDTNATVNVADNRMTNDVLTYTFTANFADKNVGVAKPVAVADLALTGADASNYALTSNVAAVTAAITARPLTVAADAQTRRYDEPNPTFTASYTGFAGDEGIEVISGFVIVSSAATNGSDAGNYAIETDTSFLFADNYAFVPSNSVLTITPIALTGSVTTSLNPARPGSNVTFTATLAGSTLPTGNVQFYADGAVLGGLRPLSSGGAALTTAALAHGAHTISAVFAGNVNFSATSNTLASAQIINRAPVAVADTLATHRNFAFSLAKSILAANDTDADADALTVTAVSTTSAHGGSVALAGATLTYTPPTDYAGADSFTYTLSDTFAATATGTVNVTVYSATNGPERVVSNAVLPDGNQHLVFAGIPGFTYVVQATTNLAPAVWVNLSTNTANASGQFTFDDLTAMNRAMRYYRTTTQ